jgi:UDP-glucose 4-epimerase
MKICVTGANGYIGKSLISGLNKKYSITAIARNNFDITDLKQTIEWFSNKKFDVVIHTAITGGSRLKEDNSDVLEINLRMHYNLLANSDKFDKFISFGSGAEIFNPNTPYGLSKKVIANSINQTLNWYNLKIFAVFDENELNTRFIKANLLHYIKKEPIIVHNNKQMDFFYMKDLISLVEYYIQNSNLPKTVDCSYKEKHTLIDIANYINTLSDYKVPIIVEDSNKFEHYSGTNHGLPINEIGLFEGINQTAKKLI